MSDDTENPFARIVRLVEAAEPVAHDAPDEDEDDGAHGELPEPADDGDPCGGGEGGDRPDMAIVRDCAALDHSDTDNGLRLIKHFGQDLAVIAQDEVTSGSWLTWTGTHWDLANGLALATLTAQRLGSRMLLEAHFIEPTSSEKQAIEAAAPLRARDWSDLNDAERQILAKADAAIAVVAKRKQRRRAFAITSKNKGRMEAAMHCAAPRLRRSPDDFNIDHYRIATLTHTLTFALELDPECPDPDVDRFVGVCRAEAGHRREDWITAVIPQAFDPEARAPRWRAFLDRTIPDPEKRRTMQMFTGLALLAIPIQHLMFHYGLGANGKSVFLETVTRVLGPSLAIGLPRESIVGGSERSSGGASPDIARLYGKRMVRILEVAGNQMLQEDMIKRLTGGEKIPVRALYKGFFEFANFAKAHMSGNDFPRVDGQDNGIWRRLLVVHWDQTIPEEEREDFETVVGRFVREEGAGILNWMIEGVCDFRTNGLFIAPAVSADTREYRDDMDPVGEFLRCCVSAVPGRKVQAHAMYEAYISWSLANAKKAVTQTRFGKRIKQTFDKSEIGGRLWYQDCELHDVPDRPETPHPHG